MRKHRIEIRSLRVLQKVNPRDFDSDDEVKARKVGFCFYFNCVVDPNLQIDLSILRKCIFSMLTKRQNMMSLSGLVRSTTRRKFSKEHIFHYVLISYDSP